MIYRASCATCGEVVIRADESSLHMAGPKTSWQCTFRCPVCRRDTLWPVPAGASHLLAAGGAQVTARTEPAMDFEPHSLPLTCNLILTMSSTPMSYSPETAGSTSSSTAGTLPTGAAAESGSGPQRPQQVAAGRDAGTGRARTQPAVPVVFGVPRALGVAAL